MSRREYLQQDPQQLINYLSVALFESLDVSPQEQDIEELESLLSQNKQRLLGVLEKYKGGFLLRGKP